MSKTALTNPRALLAAAFVACLLPVVPAVASEPADGAVLPPVLLVWDTGINPYHADFRLPDGFTVPDGYYPPDAVRVRLTLDAPDHASAVAADEAVWGGMEFGVLYAFEGTRIVGAIETEAPQCMTCPPPILDDGGHGTAVASAYAGAASGSCGQCRIVSATGAGVPAWAVGRSDIDAVSNSQSALAGIGVMPTTEMWINEWTSSGRSWFTSAGNGGANAQNHLDSFSGPSTTIRVGMDEEGPALGTRTFEAVGEARKRVATHDSLDAYHNVTGTSIAAPDVAGHYLGALWQVRSTMGLTAWSAQGLAVAPPGVPLPGDGPLADGVLTSVELEEVVLKTASAVPSPLVTLPRELSYFWEGYGSVDGPSVERALRVVEGTDVLPERPWPDYWHAYDQWIRETWGSGFAPCKADLQAFHACLIGEAQAFQLKTNHRPPSLEDAP